MQCNIDARGKAVRLVIGAISLIAGVALFAAWWQGAHEAFFYVGLGAMAGGAFGIFEGAAGWCVVRALGMKTPL